MSSTRKVDNNGIQFFNLLTGTHKDYTVNYADWLNDVSDTISSAEFSSTDVGLAFSSLTRSSTTHSGWVSPSAGNANTTYTFASKIFTAGGRVEKTKFKLIVGD